jgi:glycerol kinase
LQASVGDQSAALISSIGNNHSDVLVNLGTGGFVIRSLDTSSPDRATMPTDYLRTLVYQDGNHHAHLALEGTLNSLAAALAPYPVEACHAADSATRDIFCTVEPSGLGAPYFREEIGIRFSDSTENLTPHQIACLLLEGIIFRVVKILEEFHSDSPIDRIYLSGGLSNLNYLQQGIAQCAPCNVYLLQQKDSSLQGAALLAAGWVSTDLKVTTTLVLKINSSLPEKYDRWKKWFDNQLVREPDAPL